MSSVLEYGRTRLDTRRQRARRVVAALAALVGALLAAWCAAAIISWVTGGGWRFPRITVRWPIESSNGGLLGLPKAGQPASEPPEPQFPLVVFWPVSGWATAAVAVPLWLVWARFMVRPLLQGLSHEARHQGLASLGAIRASLGQAAARAAGRFTLPETPRWKRATLATETFGMFLGTPKLPKSHLGLWATWEQRVRIIARTGWGKTSRILVPIIRRLPGAAIVSSTEPAIFEQTVLARHHRRIRLRGTLLNLLLRPWLPTREYPVAVLDFSAPEARYAAGWPRVKWNPIDGCADYTTAYRRAIALVTGVESDQDSHRGGDTDRFFRDSASEVLSAWLHAADLGDYEITDLEQWLQHPDDSRPSRVLEDNPRADPSAHQGLSKHLDPRAEKTSSGVERYLTLALRSLTSTDGRALCGQRFDRAGNRLTGFFDMIAFIETEGTIYVLADPSRIDRARPLLSMFTNEMFFAAEAAALRRGGVKRLPRPFMGVLDELRYGVTVSSLPYVANAQRKYGIGYIYSVQSSTQEDGVYGDAAQALRDAAGVSLYGGIDIGAAKELSDRAGSTPVVTPTRGDMDSEHIQMREALTIADQQNLNDGDSVVVARGLAPFLAHTDSIYDRRRGHRTIAAEATAVARDVAAARAREQATQHLHHTTGHAAADELGKDTA